MTVTQTGDAPVRLTRRTLRAAGALRAAPAGLADERALVEALDAVADLTATSHAPAGRPPEVVEAPRTWLPPGLPPAPRTPPAASRSRREHRLAERRGADRRAGPVEPWTGPERRAGQRRAGERRAALVAERSRPRSTAAIARPAARGAVPRRAGPLVQLVGGVVVIGLLVAAGSWWVVRGHPVPAAPAPAPAAAAPTSVTLLVGLTAADGLTSVALLGADGSTAVSLLLPGDVLVDDGAAGLTRLSDPEAASPDAAGDAVADALGVRVDGAWVLTTAGLAGLVDAAGGVRVDVDRATTAGAIQVPAGPGRLTGAQAAVHATSLAAREPVQARLSRFQAVLAGLVAGLPAAPDRLAAALRGLGAQSSASLPGDRLAMLLVAVRAAAGTGPLAGTVVPLRPVEAAAGLAAAQAVDSTAARALVGRLLPDAVATPSTVLDVRVVDGLGRPGLTEAAWSRLRAAGLGGPAGAPAGGPWDLPPGPSTGAPGDGVAAERTTVTVPGSDETARATGERVAAALGVPVSAVRLGGPTDGAGVLVVLRRDFADDVAARGV